MIYTLIFIQNLQVNDHFTQPIFIQWSNSSFIQCNQATLNYFEINIFVQKLNNKIIAFKTIYHVGT